MRGDMTNLEVFIETGDGLNERFVVGEESVSGNSHYDESEVKEIIDTEISIIIIFQDGTFREFSGYPYQLKGVME